VVRAQVKHQERVKQSQENTAKAITETYGVVAELTYMFTVGIDISHQLITASRNLLAEDEQASEAARFEVNDSQQKFKQHSEQVDTALNHASRTIRSRALLLDTYTRENLETLLKDVYHRWVSCTAATFTIAAERDLASMEKITSSEFKSVLDKKKSSIEETQRWANTELADNVRQLERKFRKNLGVETPWWRFWHYQEEIVPTFEKNDEIQVTLVFFPSNAMGYWHDSYFRERAVANAWQKAEAAVGKELGKEIEITSSSRTNADEMSRSSYINAKFVHVDKREGQQRYSRWVANWGPDDSSGIEELDEAVLKHYLTLVQDDAWVINLQGGFEPSNYNEDDLNQVQLKGRISATAQEGLYTCEKVEAVLGSSLRPVAFEEVPYLRFWVAENPQWPRFARWKWGHRSRPWWKSLFARR
jgi:hypothetical protein